jgi:hypothetical protein
MIAQIIAVIISIIVLIIAFIAKLLSGKAITGGGNTITKL